MSVLWKASAAASALVFVSALEVSGQTVIDDREFVSWSHFSRVMDDPNAVGLGPGTSTSSGGQQDVTVGNPAPAFVAVHTIRYGDLILTGGIKEDVTYAPGQSGAIGRIDVSVDLRQFVIGVTAWQLVLRQGGKLYYSYPWREFSFGAWRSVSWEGLTAESFDTNPAAGRFGVNPDGDTPDFSAGASPLQFGIAVLNNLGRSGTVINTIAFDNFRVTLTPRDYQITGQVRDLNDTGIQGVTVTLTGAGTATATTDALGNYAFPDLPPGGNYTVTAAKALFSFFPGSQGFQNLQRDEVASPFVAQSGSYTRYFAEGATSSFFNTEIAILNATGQPTTATVRFQRPSPAAEVTHTVALEGIERVTLDPKSLGLAQAEFSTVIESTQPVIADRTMTWDATAYGSHAETSIGRPLTRWYLAEGATINGFDLFYLIQNPGTTAALIEVQYLLPAPLAPIVKSYVVDPLSRFNIWVNQEGGPLGAAEVSAVITSTNGVPVIVERAMYRNLGTQVFGAGHESAGVEALAPQWFFAEGATGPYFDLFFLIANPNTTSSSVEARYLKPDGSVVTRTYVVAPNSRFNVWVDFEGQDLANTAVATTFRVTNAVPVVIERSMWWWGDITGWYEGHNSAGATLTGEKWGLAAGEVGGATLLETYILIANTSPTAGSARVTLTFDDGTQATKDFALPANSRSGVAVAVDFPEANSRRFGAIVESIGSAPAQIVVERAMYNNARGVFWAAGTAALATRLR